LVANSAALNLPTLIYDVQFTNIVVDGLPQYLAPFAFTAPATNTTVCITDTATAVLPYAPPSNTDWVPPTTGQPKPIVAAHWRQRAAMRRNGWTS